MQRRLDRLDDAALIEEYRRLAIEHMAATQSGDYKRTNRAADGLAAIARIVRTRDEPARARSGSLLTDDDIAVRVWAATHFRAYDPDAAEAVLRAIAAGPRSEGRFAAEVVLKEWQAGRLKLP